MRVFTFFDLIITDHQMYQQVDMARKTDKAFFQSCVSATKKEMKIDKKEPT